MFKPKQEKFSISLFFTVLSKFIFIIKSYKNDKIIVYHFSYSYSLVRFNKIY